MPTAKPSDARAPSLAAPVLRTTAWTAAALGIALGCSSTAREQSGLSGGVGVSGAGTDGLPAADGGVGTTGDGPTGSADESADDDTIHFDLSSGNAEAGLPDDGCSKVDFLFIIDNSISMGDEQDSLGASFPGFIATIEQQVADDYHVMVIDTDPEDKWDEELVECYSGDCDGEPADEPCGILQPESGWLCGALPTPDACDATLGAGIDHDGSDARTSCGLENGQRWFSQSQPNPAAAFDCIAHLYDGNSPELTMDGMLSALGPAMNGPGGCNDGFLRDDAILVVTFISDEEDDGDSVGQPQAWHDQLLALKGGNESAIVMLGLLGDTGLPDATCPPDSVAGSNGGEYAPRLIEVVDAFGERGIWGSVCADDYGPFFTEAVALIGTACDTFEPEG